jgi:hypothetical protein
MTTFGDMVKQFGGVPVAQNNFAGWWGRKVYFVDYSGGTVGADGTSIDHPAKYLQTAIDNASAWDTIYIRPATPDTAGGDPDKHLPAASTQWSITSTKHGLQLIGTGFGGGRVRANMTRLQGASDATGAVMTCHAPFVNFENITFRRGSSTTAGLLINGQGTGTTGGYAFDVSVKDCGFWKIGYQATKGAVAIDSAWHCWVDGSWFEECALGVGYHVTGSNVVGANVVNSVFIGVDTTVDADIFQPSGTITEVFINRCVFAHDIPALAANNLYNKYIDFQTASGIISNSAFGTETETIATNMDRSNCDVVNCWFTNTTNLNPNAD